MTESLPRFFRERFDLVALGVHPGSIVCLDRALRIVWLNTGWAQFARDNDGADLLPRFGIGQPYLEGIGGGLRPRWARILTHTLGAAAPWEADYDCSSPEEPRTLRIRIFPLEGEGLLLVHSARVADALDDEAALEALYQDPSGLYRQCSYCRRMRSRHGSWDVAPEWVGREPMSTSHGMCEPCAAYYWGRLSAP